VAQWIVEEYRTRRIHGLGDGQRTGHADCGNTLRFDCAGDQSDGLVADRSDRDENGDVDFVFD
jgi:hypothetical protein